MASTVAQNQANGQQSMKMPGVDYAGLSAFLGGGQQPTAQTQGNTAQPAANPASKAGAAGQTPRPPVSDATQSTPDVVAAQEEFKNIKNGDKYTDENGNPWEWSVFEYTVVPEKTKDEQIDELSVEEAPGGEEEDNLEQALDVALAVLREEEGEGGESPEAAARTEDEAIRLVMDAIDDVLGIPTEDAWTSYTHKELDGKKVLPEPDGTKYTDGIGLTVKETGFNVINPETEVPKSKLNKNQVTQNEDGTYHVRGNLGTQAYKAKDNAHKTHRRPVAATYDKCRAKDKARCPFHGAAYMTAQLGKIIAANGLPLGKYGVVMDDSEEAASSDKNAPLAYRLLFSVPEGTPMEVRNKIAKEFFAKNPSIMLTKAAMFQENINDNTVFLMQNPEDIDDFPVDAPTQEDYDARHDIGVEGTYQERAKARNAAFWWDGDNQFVHDYFNMLSERPTNIAELNEDIMRYAQEFPEALPPDLPLDKLRKDYEAFNKANANKGGIQAYIAHGIMVNKAEALAKAAEMGLKKEAARYYDIAEKIYNQGAEVFSSVQNYLEEQMGLLQKEARTLRNGEEFDYKKTPYIGSKYKGTKGFPTTGYSKEMDAILADGTRDYKAAWSSATRGWNYAQLGCEQREPLLVLRGLSLMNAHIKVAKELEQALASIQDDLLDMKNPRWLKRHGFSAAASSDKASVDGAASTEKGSRTAKKESKEKVEAEEAIVQPEEQRQIETPQETKAIENPEQEKDTGSSEEETAENGEVAESQEEEKNVEVESKKDRKKAASKKGKERRLADKGNEDAKASQTTEEVAVETKTNIEIDPAERAQLEEIMAAARKDKGLQAMDRQMKEARKHFGVDSEQYAAAKQKASAAIAVFKEKYIKEHFGEASAKGTTESVEAPTATPTKEKSDAENPAQGEASESGKEEKSADNEADEHMASSEQYDAEKHAHAAKKTPTAASKPPEAQSPAKPAEGVEGPSRASAATSTPDGKGKVVKPKVTKQTEKVSATGAKGGESATTNQNSGISVKKTPSAKVEESKGTESKATSTNASGAAKVGKTEAESSLESGVEIVKSIKIPDKPTLEDATKMNEQFANLESRIRGLSSIYQSRTSDSAGWKKAQSEMNALKSELDGLVKSARGKGISWTKDSSKFGLEGPSDKRPLDMPTNFRISAITDKNGNRVEVPYKAPPPGKMDTAGISEAEEPKAEAQTSPKTTPAKEKATNYAKAFSEYDEKIGEVDNGMSVSDLIEIEGYEVIPKRTADGKLYHFLAKPGKTPSGVDTSHKYVTLEQVFGSRKLGSGDKEFKRFVEAIERKVKSSKAEKAKW